MNSDKLANYIYSNYESIRGEVDLEQILDLVEFFPDNIIAIEENGVLKGVANYVKLTDNLMVEIVEGKRSIENPEDVSDFLLSTGDNIHFLFVVAKNARVILKGLKEVIDKEDPHSVSWFKPNGSLRFIKLRRKLCHH